mgnify:CR=1 FL=1|tara:strand:- start:4891 stop:5100 length:210 start_codon:yes stop_codon:yes gene_type:complete
MPGIEKTMDEFKAGKLKSGSGQTVTDRGQALAIALAKDNSTRKMASGGSVCGRPTGQGYRSSRKPKGMA